MTSGTGYDPGVIERLKRLGGEALAFKIVDLFLETVPEKLEAIRDGSAASDLPAIERAAHSLRSSSGNVGAGAMADQAARVEAHARAESIPDLTEAIRHLEEGFAAVRPRIVEVRTDLDRDSG